VSAPAPRPVAASAPAQPAAAAAAPAAIRACPTCGKNPGKGKFCIECGSFVGASTPAAQPQPEPAVELVTTAAVVEAQPADSAPPTFPTFAQPATALVAAPPEPQPALRRASLLESPQQIAEVAGSAYGAPPSITKDAPLQPGVIQGSKRQTVTGFNLDPSRLGYPSPTQQPAKGGQGIEF
jgi:hypothetical protein